MVIVIYHSYSTRLYNFIFYFLFWSMGNLQQTIRLHKIVKAKYHAERQQLDLSISPPIQDRSGSKIP